jgi:hypothetical protein
MHRIFLTVIALKYLVDFAGLVQVADAAVF